MLARIYQPARTAMQSGQAKDGWVLEFTPAEQKKIDPLMGWTGSGDMNGQVRIAFDTQEAAVAYAEKNGLAYQVEVPKKRAHVIKPGGYGGNFAHNRRGAWTH
ncbi:MAG: ETC complex I subunit [Pikeienuella sp.]